MLSGHCRHRQSPRSLELSGRNEMLIWCLTFLTSTWYIKNPFLKAKIVILCTKGFEIMDLTECVYH